LRPVIRVKAGTDLALAAEIHHRIPEVCFIARSVNFPVDHAPRFIVED
jgi:organic hydroperoxide reductase OsmC/OhrA